MLVLENLSCGYGPFRAVQSLNLKLEEGSVNALIGANGAGKSSTLMSIAGHVKIQEGKVFYKNNELNQIAVHNRIRLGIALVPEGRRLFPDLSVEENLKIGAYHKSKQRYSTNLEKVFELFPRLKDRIEQLAGSLSGGEQQMLATARALCIQPKFLLLDEPSEGLMPKYVERIFETVERLKKEKVGILLVEQKIDGVLKISDRVAFLENGNLEHQTTPEALAENDEPLYRYVGIKSRK